MELSDHLIIDELKVNCLKFISLNIVSFLEPSYLDRLLSLPIYLIRDLQNFIKINDSDKYLMFDMKVVEDVEMWAKSNEQEESKEGAGKVVGGSVITREYCAQVFDDIAAKFEEYERNSRY